MAVPDSLTSRINNWRFFLVYFFFFNDTATTEIYTLSLHDALPISSVTWITSYYPKGKQYAKWLAGHGWDEAQAIMMERGDNGTKVHYAVSQLLTTGEISMKDRFPNHKGELEEVTVEEYSDAKYFADWIKSLESFELLVSEGTYFNEEHEYAGTIDIIARINGQLYVIDLKTSPNIYPSYGLHVAAYGKMNVPLEILGITQKEWSEKGLAILQVGNRNKNHYKFTELDNSFGLFLSTKEIWANECAKVSPKQIELPVKITIGDVINVEKKTKELKKVVKTINKKL